MSQFQTKQEKVKGIVDRFFTKYSEDECKKDGRCIASTEYHKRLVGAIEIHTREEAIAFVDWYNENSWQEDFSAEATHTTEQLYEIFINDKNRAK